MEVSFLILKVLDLYNGRHWKPVCGLVDDDDDSDDDAES